MASRPPRKRTRVFVDSSVLMAAAISATGFARDLILAGQLKDVTLVLSALVVEETERNLRRKALAAIPAFEFFLTQIPFATTEASRALVRRVAKVVELKDAAIVAGAMSGKVQYLATYDRRHLLSQAGIIRAAFGVDVVTPDIVIGMWKAQGQGLE